MPTPKCWPKPRSVSATSFPPRPGTNRDPAAHTAGGSGRALADQVLHRLPRRGTRRLTTDSHLLSRRDETATHLIQERRTHPTGETAPDRHRPATHPAVPALAADRTGLLGVHMQPASRGHQIVLPLHRRRTARPPRPDHPDTGDPAEEHPGPGTGAPDRRRGQNAAHRTRHVRAVRAHDPGWAPGLRVTPHILRRSRAMHLIQAGVNLIYVRDLLGHADIATTEIYARADAETKRKAIENAYQPLTPDTLPDWTADTSLIGWLDSLGT